MWFVAGAISGVTAPFLVDPGADASVLSLEYFESLSDAAQAKLMPTPHGYRLSGVWGDNAEPIGMVEFTIRLGGANFCLEAFVMDS